MCSPVETSNNYDSQNDKFDIESIISFKLYTTFNVLWFIDIINLLDWLPLVVIMCSAESNLALQLS